MKICLVQVESDNQHLKDQIFSLVNDNMYCSGCKISNSGNELNCDNVINNKDISKEIDNNNNNEKHNNSNNNDKTSNNSDNIKRINVNYDVSRNININSTSYEKEFYSMDTRVVQRKISYFNTAYLLPPETDFEYVS